MTVIPNGIDLRRISDATPAEDLLVGPSTSSGTDLHRVLMVSAFRPEKDQQTLIRAIAQLPENYHLFLAGGAETLENQRILDSCKALAKEQQDRIHFLGIRSDVPALLAAVDVIVLSSKHEGMSLSVLEGMASGKPLIASDVDGLRELVSGAGLLFPQGDAKALVARIREVCDNPGKAREIAQKGLARARQYDIAETARKYQALYKSVLMDGNVRKNCYI